MAKYPQILLVDVQNVLHAVGELRYEMHHQSHEQAIRLLADYVAPFPEVWLFEDGGSTSLTRVSRACWRVGSGSDCADNQIIKWLQRNQQRRPAMVVSADRDLGMRARGLSARTIGPESFWRKFIGPSQRIQEVPSAKPDRTLSACEVDMWMKLFGEKNDVTDGEANES